MSDPIQPPYGSAPVPPPSAPMPPPVAPPPAVPQAPPGAYTVPVGGYQAPVGGFVVPPAEPPASPVTGIVALIAALVAAVVVPVVGGILAFQIGTLVPTTEISTTGATDLSVLSPARTQVLWAEIAFWAGTVIGTCAFVLGIVATVKRRGRGQGIAAIVLSALGPALFFGAVFVLLAAGGISAVVP